MALKRYSRLELAENQLRAAFSLLASGGDRFSAITLAGAADVILSQLVIRAGKENFTERALRLEMERGGEPAVREVFGREINDLLFINELKHMDEDDDGIVEMEPEECAIAAVSKAMANYAVLAGKDADLLQVFRYWVKLNLDPKKYNVDCEPNWKPPAENAGP